MWGGAASVDATVALGHNTFVFAATAGHDTIEDFHHGLDVIDLTGFASAGVHHFADLLLAHSGGATVLTFASGTMINVAGMVAVEASDFHFA